MKALEKDRARRYETASGFARDIRALPRRRGGRGLPAVGRVPAAEVRPQAPRGAGDRLGVRGAAGPRGGAEHLAGDPRPRGPGPGRSRGPAADSRPRALDERDGRDRAQARPRPRRRPRARRPGNPRPRPRPCSDFFQDQVLAAARPEGQEGGLGQGRDPPHGGRRRRAEDRRGVPGPADRRGFRPGRAGDHLPLPGRTGAGDPTARARPGTSDGRPRPRPPRHPRHPEQPRPGLPGHRPAGPRDPAVRADPGGPDRRARPRPPEHPHHPEQPRPGLPGRRPAGPGDPALRADPGGPGGQARPRPPRHPPHPEQPRRRPTRTTAGWTGRSRCSSGPWPPGRPSSAPTTPTPSSPRTTSPRPTRTPADWTWRSRCSSRRWPPGRPGSAPTTRARSPPRTTSPRPTGPPASSTGPSRCSNRPWRPGRPSSAPTTPTRSPASTTSPWPTRTPAGWTGPSPLLERTLAAQKARLGPDHPDTLTTQNNLALAYRDAGQYERAIPLFEQTLAVETARLGADHPDTLTTQNNLALTYRDDGQWDRAIALFERTLAARTAEARRRPPRHPPHPAEPGDGLPGGRPVGPGDRAVRADAGGPDGQARRRPSVHAPDPEQSRPGLPGRRPGRPGDRAAGTDAGGPRGEARRRPPEHPHAPGTTSPWPTRTPASWTGRSRCSSGRSPTGRPSTAPTTPGPSPRDYDLADAYEARGDTARAEAMLRDVLAARKKKLGAGAPGRRPDPLRPGRGPAGAAEVGRGRAAPPGRPGDLGAKRPDDWSRFDTQSLLGDSLLGQKKYAEAEPLLLSGYEGLKAREARIPGAEQDPADRGRRAGRAALRGLGQAREGRRRGGRGSAVSTCRPTCSVDRDQSRARGIGRLARSDARQGFSGDRGPAARPGCDRELLPYAGPSGPPIQSAYGDHGEAVWSEDG